MDPSGIAAVLLGSAVVSAIVTAILGHWNELARAREERRQERLGKTYLRAIEMLLTTGTWVSRTHPFMEKASQAPPKLPGDEEQRLISARLAAYGSPAMQQAWQQCGDCTWAFVHAVEDYESLEIRAKRGSETAGETLPAARQTMYDIREKRVMPAIRTLIDIANAELAERRLGTWARLRSRVWGAMRRPDRWVRAHMQRAAPSSGKGAAQ